jgi:hypothetical protein
MEHKFFQGIEEYSNILDRIVRLEKSTNIHSKEKTTQLSLELSKLHNEFAEILMNEFFVYDKDSA